MPEHEIHTGNLDALGRPEMRQPHNPSEQLGGDQLESARLESRQAAAREKDTAEAMAYAAKPFMDVAVRLHHSLRATYEHEQRGQLSDDDKTEIMSTAGLKELIELGDRHAKKAERAARRNSFAAPALSEPEQKFLGAMQVAATHAEAQSHANLDAFWADDNPLAVEQMVQKFGGHEHRGRQITLEQRLRELKDDTESYAAQAGHSSETALTYAGQAALDNRALTTDEHQRLSERTNFLKRETELFSLIAQQYPVEAKPAQAETAAPAGEDSLPDPIDVARARVSAATESATNRSEFHPAAPESAEALVPPELQDVLDSSRGTTLVNTDMPSQPDQLRQAWEAYRGDYAKVRSGFQMLGDQETPLASNHIRRVSRFMTATPVAAESLFTSPLTEAVYTTESYKTKSGIFGRKSTGTRLVESGERPVMTTNPLTGQAEPAVKLAYQFDTNENFRRPKDQQVKYITNSGRPGNYLVVEVAVPQSIAAKFTEAVKQRPELAREFARRVAVSDRTGLTDAQWRGASHEPGTGGTFKVEPPYENLPPDWSLSIYDEAAKTEVAVKF